MNVIAKFRCHSVTKNADGSRRVHLNPVCGDENKPWSMYTPSGEIQMLITNPELPDEAFAPGKNYLVTFEPAQ